MAFASVYNIICASREEVFRHIKDWLASRNGIADYTASGLGWTVHDQVFATDADTVATGDYVVLSSPGESGEHDLQVQLTLETLSNRIYRLRNGLWWNPSSKAWVLPNYDNTTKGANSGAELSVSMSGDLDAFIIAVRDTAQELSGVAYNGLLDTEHVDPSVARTTAAVSSGSAVVIPMVSVPPAWQAGMIIYLWDQAGMDRAEITAIVGTDITVASLARGFTSGARVALRHHYITTSNQTFGAGYGLIGLSGATNSFYPLSESANPGFPGYGPDHNTGKLATSRIVHGTDNAIAGKGVHGWRKHCLYVGTDVSTPPGTLLTAGGVDYRLHKTHAATSWLIRVA